MTSSRVSIVIPVYNVEKIIDKAIESIINQTYKDIEIILIDDGSSDNSRDVCNKYKQEDSRIKLISIQNGGPSRARNIGIEHATGKYLMFCDSDDQYNVDMVKTMVENIEKHNTQLVVCGIEKIDEKNNRMNTSKFKSTEAIKKEDVLIDMGHDNFLFYPLWNKIYNLEIINRYNIRMNTSLFIGEDLCFNLEYINKCENILTIEDILYKYYTSNSILTHKYFENYYEKRLIVVKTFEKIYIENNLPLDNIYYQYIKIIYAQGIMYSNDLCNIDYRQKLNRIRKIFNLDYTKLVTENYKAKSIYNYILLKLINQNLIIVFYFVCKVMYKLKKIRIIMS